MTVATFCVYALLWTKLPLLLMTKKMSKVRKVMTTNVDVKPCELVGYPTLFIILLFFLPPRIRDDVKHLPNRPHCICT